MGNQPSNIAAAPGFEASGLLMWVTGVFAFAHFATGLLALIFEMDALQGTLLDTGDFKKAPVLKKGSWAEFLRGPKRNGAEKAPNVRAWGARQASLSIPYWTALMVGDKIAYQVAFMCLFGRICGDIMQNLLDGCMWKVGLFVSFEGFALTMIYTFLL